MSKPKPEPVIMPDKFCSVCGRVLWGNWQPLGHDKGRHEECGLGSEAWLEHYHTLSKAEQEPLKEFFTLSYPQAEGMQQ